MKPVIALPLLPSLNTQSNCGSPHGLPQFLGRYYLPSSDYSETPQASAIQSPAMTASRPRAFSARPTMDGLIR